MAQTALPSRLREEGTNLFLEIKALCTEAERKGRKLSRLSIGQPTGPALLSARKAAAEAVMDDSEPMHGYQDNESPGVPDFAPRFVHAIVQRDLRGADIAYLPIPGIKPMLGLVPLAYGHTEAHDLLVATTTRPGYPTPRDWCGYLNQEVHELTLTPKNAFRFRVRSIPEHTALIMMNYPHNPSGQTVTRAWLEELCLHCVIENIRLFNDAAYAPLAHRRTSLTLTEVAVGFPALSWMEAFSASKVIDNGTGWRVGAMVGSPDFVRDMAKIKGNTDSGFVAFSAAGVIYAVENDRESIKQARKTYERRLRILINLLTRHGMQLAVRPGAGFFTLWKVPQRAFGEEIIDAEHFNRLMILRTGVAGVHFDPYIRYAVVGDVEAMLPEIDKGFTEAAVSYN